MHLFIVLLLMMCGYWITFIWNVPLLAYHIWRYFNEGNVCIIMGHYIIYKLNFKTSGLDALYSVKIYDLVNNNYLLFY